MGRLSFQKGGLSCAVAMIALVYATFVLAGCAGALNNSLSYGDNESSQDAGDSSDDDDDSSDDDDDTYRPLPDVHFYAGKKFENNGVTYLSISLYNGSNYYVDSACVTISTASPYVSNLINGDPKSNSAYFGEIRVNYYKTYEKRCVAYPSDLDYGDYKTAPFSFNISSNCPEGQRIYFNVRVFDFHSNEWVQKNAFYITN